MSIYEEVIVKKTGLDTAKVSFIRHRSFNVKVSPAFSKAAGSTKV
jgi:hypothetical protein